MSEYKVHQRQRITLVGIGMGGQDAVTVQAVKAIKSGDCLIGARRMLECAGRITDTEGKKLYQEYSAEKITAFIQEHPQYAHITVVLSGDTGFYSGAKKLTEILAKDGQRYDVRLVPGISSIAYLAAALGTSWEDGKIISLHGQEENFIQTVSRNQKTFFLLGGKDTGRRFLERFCEFGMNDITISLGRNLSYPDEKIISGRPAEFERESADGLCAAFVFNPHPQEFSVPHVPDNAFIRGNVPMTKAEIRAVSIAQLKLSRDSVVYDVGAGTGSVSVEAARCSDRIRVYAVEKKSEAVDLLRKNRKKFHADGIRIIEGEAPEALRELEAPTHVFVGGSSGNLKEILRCVLEKNPQVRIVINAISLETVGEVMTAAEEGLLINPEIIQMNISRARKLGRYHMMTGLNPVYVVSAGKKAEETCENPEESGRCREKGQEIPERKES